MSKQEKMTIEQLARLLPPEVGFVANNGLGGCVVGVGPLTCVGDNTWDSRDTCWELPFEIDIDKPWKESQTVLRPKERFRAEKGKGYCILDSNLSIIRQTEMGSDLDLAHYESGNYWPPYDIKTQAFRDACRAKAMELHEDADE